MILERLFMVFATMTLGAAVVMIVTRVWEYRYEIWMFIEDDPLRTVFLLSGVCLIATFVASVEVHGL